jgi:hypothetical protein
MTVNNRYMPVNVATPAQTAVSAPQSTSLALGDVLLRRIDLRIPPGPSGLVGVYIEQAGTQIWPWGTLPTWITGDNDEFSVPIGTEIDNGVSIVTYNLDYNPHTLYFRFLVTPVSLVSNPAAAVPVVAIA